LFVILSCLDPMPCFVFPFQSDSMIFLVRDKVVSPKPWRFGIRGIDDRVTSHESQSVTVLGKLPYMVSDLHASTLKY
jgi:hypothetical protein